MRRRLIALVIAFGALAIALIATPPGPYQIRGADNWVSVPCTIVDAVMVEDDTGRYSAKIRYRYDIDGQIFRSSRISPGGAPVGGKQEIEKFIARYSLGGSTTCYVDPNTPSNAVLDADASGSSVRKFLPILISALAILLLTVVILRRSRGRTDEPPT